jgi:uncharacterized membrane protein YfcA
VTFLLFIVAFAGGALNSVAGGGSFLTFPTLLYAGVTPVVANATSALAMWPGSVASAVAYRRELTWGPRTMVLCGASLLGGLAGAILLVRTSDTSFMRLLPWLMLVASGTFTFAGRLSSVHRSPATSSDRTLWVLALLQLVISIYGGYFGGGMGIMMLAMFAVAGMTDIHEMNGLKAVLGSATNGIAIVAFMISREIAWAPGLLMVAGSIIGGYAGAAMARRIDRRVIRVFVMVIGWTMTTYFFVRR